MKTVTLLALAMLSLAGSLSAQDSVPKPKPPKKDPNLIAAWEIAQVPGNIRDAYELVRLLRPRFFQIRAIGAVGKNPTWSQGPGVIVNDVGQGGTDALRSVQVGAIREVRYLSGPDAANRYGVEYHAGAIIVITK